MIEFFFERSIIESNKSVDLFYAEEVDYLEDYFAEFLHGKHDYLPSQIGGFIYYNFEIFKIGSEFWIKAPLKNDGFNILKCIKNELIVIKPSKAPHPNSKIAHINWQIDYLKYRKFKHQTNFWKEYSKLKRDFDVQSNQMFWIHIIKKVMRIDFVWLVSPF